MKDFNETYKNISIYEIKNTLIEEYSRLSISLKLRSKVYDVLNSQGKKNIISKVKLNEITLPELIQSNNYYISPLDIWVLSYYYKLPLIIMNKISLQETEYKKNILKLNSSKDNMYYFIQLSQVLLNKPFTITIFSDNENKLKISLDSLSASYKQDVSDNINIIEEIKNTQTENKLYNFLESFSLTKYNLVSKRIQQPQQPEEPQQIEPISPPKINKKLNKKTKL